MVWEGLDAVKQGRAMLGATNPLQSAPGSIRGDFRCVLVSMSAIMVCSIQTGRNIIHGSDAVESANKEIAHWFKPEELVDWNRDSNKWIYE